MTDAPNTTLIFRYDLDTGGLGVVSHAELYYVKWAGVYLDKYIFFIAQLSPTED